jgi:hypothetical protein
MKIEKNMYLCTIIPEKAKISARPLTRLSRICTKKANYKAEENLPAECHRIVPLFHENSATFL